MPTENEIIGWANGTPDELRAFGVAEVEEVGRSHHRLSPYQPWVQRDDGDSVRRELMSHVGR